MKTPPEALELRALWDCRDSLPPQAADQVFQGLDPLAPWTGRLHAVRLVPFLTWPTDRRDEVIARLLDLERGENLFVKAWALDSLAHFAQEDSALLERLSPLLSEALGSSSGAVRARAKAILRRIA